HEAPTREEPPEVTEPFPAVDVCAARFRVPRGQAGRAGRVAERDHAGECQRDEQAGTPGEGGGRREHHQHPGAEARAQPDDDGVTYPEPAVERRHRTLRLLIQPKCWLTNPPPTDPAQVLAHEPSAY